MNKIDTILTKIVSDRKSQFWTFFVMLLLMSLAMVYFYLPFESGHDSYFHFGRLQSLMDALKDGRIFIYPDYRVMEGYGYFTRAFYPDFILVPFALIGNITDVEFAYQFMIFTMTVLCGIFTYKMMMRIFDSPYAAAIAALLFTFAMYRLLDIYHRGALAEASSFTFIPLVFWGLYEIVKGDYRKWYIITIGYSLLILTHALSSVLMFITMLIILVICYKSLVKDPKRLWYLVMAGMATIPIIAYFLFPMLEQMASNTFYYDVNPLTSIKDNILGTYAIVWGMFSGIVYPERAFIPGTGLLLTCAIMLRLFVYGKSKQLGMIDVGVTIGLVYIFASSYLFPWSVFPFNKLSFIQMPWRLYEFSSFFFAVAGGYYLSRILKSHRRCLLAGGMICISILFVIINDAKMYHDVRSTVGVVREKNAENNYHLIGIEYLPEKVPSVDYIASRGDVVKIDELSANISELKKDNGRLYFNVNIEKPEKLEVPFIYYKGYKAALKGEELAVSESKNGLVEVFAEKSGYIEVFYAGTALQKVSWFVSLFSILGLCVYIFIVRNKHKKLKE